MVKEGRGRLFKRADGKYLIYVPVDLCKDSMFPFHKLESGPRGGSSSVFVKVSFEIGKGPQLTIEPWKEPES